MRSSEKSSLTLITVPRWCLRVSVLASLLLVLATAFQWSLVDVLTPLLIYPLLAGAWILLFACLAWAVASFARNHRKTGWRAAYPVIVCAVAALIVLLVPFTSIWLWANYHSLKSAREQVVRQVQTGALRPNVPHNGELIALGADAPSVSMGGNEIIVEQHDGKHYIFFFTYRGILDNYSGFLFVPSGGNPRLFSDLNEAEATQLVPFEENWYFASHR